ncbi:GNAT family N-acetyltransferase [Allokutzneria sp. A3M-2-11 16]|uniref:GNAT family N-acetyltransferase n=1 Tax=Allokutzneria sp. A3M-2-11 16 TaxID=2962043 RepID=UPI0020B89143|nr:GNAT family N-acetyltransferase [Allokutzneria sp. A3M-2-11 16]MCP3804138.1 GNAT family N-acetyltransferase [Allokutzneria sp. A3M-2-11 16]
MSELLLAQRDRLVAADPRLSPTGEFAEGDGALVVEDDGIIKGYVCPVPYELGPDDPLAAFRPAKGTRWEQLVTTEPRALSLLGETAGSETISLTWPSADRETADHLVEIGLKPSSEYALRPAGPLAAGQASDVTVRPARKEDFPAVLELYRSLMNFEHEISAHIRPTPAAERATCASFDLAVAAREDNFCVVAEREGSVIGFVQGKIADVSFGMFPPGRYAYLDLVAVRQGSRGAGIGRRLVAGTLDALARHEVLGQTLWFNPNNPLSSKFWPAMGFRPILTVFRSGTGR